MHNKKNDEMNNSNLRPLFTTLQPFDVYEEILRMAVQDINRVPDEVLLTMDSIPYDAHNIIQSHLPTPKGEIFPEKTKECYEVENGVYEIPIHFSGSRRIFDVDVKIGTVIDDLYAKIEGNTIIVTWRNTSTKSMEEFFEYAVDHIKTRLEVANKKFEEQARRVTEQLVTIIENKKALASERMKERKSLPFKVIKK